MKIYLGKKRSGLVIIDPAQLYFRFEIKNKALNITCSFCRDSGYFNWGGAMLLFSLPRWARFNHGEDQ